MNALQVIVAIVLAFILPGFTLAKAIFPRRPPSAAHPHVALAFLTVALSVTVTILVGAVLGFIPAPGGSPGYFQGAATGKPYLEGSLLLVSAAFFLVGLARGAYPRLRSGPTEPTPATDPDAEAAAGRDRLAEDVERAARAGASEPRLAARGPRKRA